ncbi:pyridoxine biosynthesis protein [Savitreella phatthalungensis]
MTEGNLVRWSLKEGDEFSAGDVLLEIETDKATMDVEAQDDGILAKVLVADGSKAVKVGTNIAIMAEQGDDLELLPPQSMSVAHAIEPDGQKTRPTETASGDEVQATSAGAESHEQEALLLNNDGSQLFPSVLVLVNHHNLSSSDVGKITGTGPKGRLLKGDVLAHVGMIGKESTAQLKQDIEQRSKIDLKHKKAPIDLSETNNTRTMAPDESSRIARNSPLTIELHKNVDLTQLVLAAERFEENTGMPADITILAARAAKRALEDLPQFALPPRAADDVLFDELVGLRPNKSSFLSPLTSAPHNETLSMNIAEYFEGGVIPLPRNAPGSASLSLRLSNDEAAPRSAAADQDIFDFLMDETTGSIQAPCRAPQCKANMTASLSFIDGSVNPEAASAYLERVSRYMESPGHLYA